jgi:hypothetical protein
MMRSYAIFDSLDQRLLISLSAGPVSTEFDARWMSPIFGLEQLVFLIIFAEKMAARQYAPTLWLLR